MVEDLSTISVPPYKKFVTENGSAKKSQHSKSVLEDPNTQNQC